MTIAKPVKSRAFKRFGEISNISEDHGRLLVTLVGPSGFQENIMIADPAFQSALRSAGVGANIWTRVVYILDASGKGEQHLAAIYLSINGQKIEPTAASLNQIIAPSPALT